MIYTFSVIHQHNLTCEALFIIFIFECGRRPHASKKMSYGEVFIWSFTLEELPHTERGARVVCLFLSLYTRISPKATPNLDTSHGLHGHEVVSDYPSASCEWAHDPWHSVWRVIE